MAVTEISGIGLRTAITAKGVTALSPDSPHKGRASAEQIQDLYDRISKVLEQGLGMESYRAAMLFIQTVFMDGMRGQLVAIADPRPGRPIDMVFTTSHAAVTIDMATRRAIA
jgi:hypothetical protein